MGNSQQKSGANNDRCRETSNGMSMSVRFGSDASGGSAAVISNAPASKPSSSSSSMGAAVSSAAGLRCATTELVLLANYRRSAVDSVIPLKVIRPANGGSSAATDEEAESQL